MRSILFSLRADLRTRLAGAISLVLLLGVLGGVALAAGAGARRTGSAFDRMVRESNASDAIIAAERGGRANGFFEDVRALDGIRDGAVVLGFQVERTGATVRSRLAPMAGIDTAFMYELDRPRLLSGRMPAPTDPNEILVNREFADAERVHAGDTISLTIYERADTDFEARGDDVGSADVTVTGIGLFPHEVVPATDFDSQPIIFFTPAFAQKYRAAIAFEVFNVRFDPGVETDDLREQVHQMVKERDLGGLFFTPRAEPFELARRAIRPQAIAFAVFAGLLGITIVFVIGQLIARQVFLDASEFTPLRAIGMTSGQLFVLAIARAGSVVVAGGALAVAVAIGLSPTMPIGPARLAEPSPGIDVDLAGLGLGALALVSAILAVGAIAAARSVALKGRTADGDRAHVSRLAAALARMKVAVTVPIGVRLAVAPGSGRRSLPVRSTIAGVAVAIAAVTTAITFGQNMHRLVYDGERFGQNWHLTVDGSFNPITNAEKVVGGDPDVGAYAGATAEDVSIDGIRVPAVGVDDVDGAGLGPTIVEGRAPATRDEIALGTRSLERLGKRVGSTVAVDFLDARREMRIVGRAVFAAIGLGSFSPTGLGDGAFVTYDALIGDDPERQRYGFVFVQLADESRLATVRARLLEATRGALGEACAEECAIRDELAPGDILSYRRIAATPNILAAILVLLAVATLAHVMLTSIGRRARDLAVLKTLGFVRRQTFAVVAWQASTLTLLAVITGVPAGVFAGRRAWQAFADQLGVPRVAYVSVPATIAIAVLTLVLANLVAAVPARIAARISPARVLRSE